MTEVPVKSSGQVEVVRVGATIRRPTRDNSPAVHALLEYLESVGFAGAPRFLGYDEGGREVLTWIEGDPGSPGGEPDERMVSEARLLRRFHDAVEGFELPPGVAFRPPPALASSGPLACHNDVAPNNTVFRRRDAVALIDWNHAGWGERIWDVSNAVWRGVPLFDPEWLPGRFRAEPLEQGRRLRLYADAYQLVEADRERLLATVRVRQESLAASVQQSGGGERPGARWLRNAAYIAQQEPTWTAMLLA